MCRKHLTLIFAILLVISLVGCGIRSILPSKKVPPLEGYSTVVLVLDFRKPSEMYKGLPTMVSYGIGTNLSVRYQEKNWIFDQSQDLAPVSDKLKELNISSTDVYQDAQAAAKLAESFQADLVIVGQIWEPKFTEEPSGKIEYDMTQKSTAGTARFYAIFQTALLKAELKVMTEKPEAIWDGKIVGYEKYKTRYRTGDSPKTQREETMLADVRKDLVKNAVEKLYPKAEEAQ